MHFFPIRIAEIVRLKFHWNSSRMSTAQRAVYIWQTQSQNYLCCSKSQSVGILAAALDAVKGELSARSILSLTADPPALSLPRRAQCMAVRLTLRIRNVWGLAIKLRIVVVVAVAAAAVARSFCCCGIPTIARFICLASLSGSQTLVEVGWNRERERGGEGGHIRQVYKQSAWLAV